MKPRDVIFATVVTLGLSSTAPGAEAATGVTQLFVAGDSTAFGYEPNPRNQQGWAAVLQPYFDERKLRVVNAARGGRSSRTFITEGLWDQLLSQLRQGDYVIIQFGHNDAGPVNEEPPGSKRPPRARGTLPGIGTESREIDNLVTKKHETVRTFGWYVRKMIRDVRAKGATPILLTPTKANSWKRGRIPCEFDKYRQWTYQLATEEKVVFLDLSRITADRYQREGTDKVKGQFIDRDNLHTNLSGAQANARDVVSGLRALDTLPLRDMLSNEGRKVTADSGPAGDSVCAAPGS
jgi:lysophospholipase L1-like esterase